MDEELAQKIMAIYLKIEWGVKLKPRKSGPDFLHKGKAIEVKGSDLKVANAVLQFARYTNEYTDFGLAFPYDALSGKNLIQIHVLSKIWYTMFNKFLTVYLIREQSERYGVLKIYSASDLIRMICEHLNLATLWREKDMEKLLKNIELTIKKSFNYTMRNEAKSLVDTDNDTIWLPKSPIVFILKKAKEGS